MENQNLPIILIPGLGGSQLEGRLMHIDLTEPNITTNWSILYLSLTKMFNLNALYKSLKLIPNKDFTEMINSNTNLLLRTNTFGTVDGIKYLDKKTSAITYIYYYMIKFLKESLGYEKNFNLYGAPYDFRKVTTKTEIQKFFNNLDNLISIIYEKHNKPCILITHSLGCLLILKYLTLKTKTWKKLYINSWISMSGPFGGCMDALKSLTYGKIKNYLDFSYDNTLFLNASRSFPSIYNLIPTACAFGNNYVVLQTPIEKFTPNNYNLLFKKFGIENYDCFHNINSNIEINKSIDVYTLFIYSIGVKTLSKLISFENGFEEEFDDGDGTVNKISLEQCYKYYNKDPTNTEVVVLKNINHHKILKNQQTFNVIKTFIEKRKKIWNETHHGIHRCLSSIF